MQRIAVIIALIIFAFSFAGDAGANHDGYSYYYIEPASATIESGTPFWMSIFMHTNNVIGVDRAQIRLNLDPVRLKFNGGFNFGQTEFPLAVSATYSSGSVSGRPPVATAPSYVSIDRGDDAGACSYNPDHLTGARLKVADLAIKATFIGTGIAEFDPTLTKAITYVPGNPYPCEVNSLKTAFPFSIRIIDTINPTTSIMAPRPFSVASGTIPVLAYASDTGSGIAHVDVTCDGFPAPPVDAAWTTGTDMYAAQYDTLQCSTNGNRILKVVAYDYASNTATATTTILVSNPASNPVPMNGATNVLVTSQLSWTGINLTRYNVYLGTTQSPPRLASLLTVTNWKPATNLSYGSTYYWRIGVVDQGGREVIGPLWSFSTETPPPPLLNFSGNPSSILQGDSVVLSWAAYNVTYCTAFGGWSGTKPVVGNQVVYPAQTNTYTMACTGPGGSITKSVSIYVTVPTPTPTPYPTFTPTPTPFPTFSPTPTPYPTATLSPTPPPTSTKFRIGDRVQATANLNVRSYPGGTLLGYQPSGAQGVVRGGPQLAANMWWWDIGFDVGISGWSVENYLVKISSGPTKSADINKDGRVDVLDLGILLSQWGFSGSVTGDINGDYLVNVLDLSIMLANWG